MSQFKWGGPFTAIDKVARKPLSGVVAGTFDGTFPPDQQHALSGAILVAFGSVVGGLQTSLAEATSNLEDLSRRLTQQAADDLSRLGASGQATIVSVRLR